MSEPLHVKIQVDGGSRGNPGPAAAGVVITEAGSGIILHEAGYFLGRATNNVAEYSALIAGLRAAGRLKADQVEVLSDSELMVRQMNGQYRVRNAGLKPLHDEASELARRMGKFAIAHVSRSQNVKADRLVNMALNAKRNVEDAAD